MFQMLDKVVKVVAISVVVEDEFSGRLTSSS